MIIPDFIFDEDINGYLTEPFTMDEQCAIHIELASKAPVVVLKQEGDGEFANYGQTPEESDRYKLDITSNDEVTLRLATPVEVTKCYIIN